MNPVFFSKQLPAVQKILLSPQFKQALVLCDKRFQSALLLKKWRANKKLKFYYVKSGEQTKSLEQLPQHIEKINTLISDFDKKAFLFIGVGGGSVLDLTGFLASVYKRGLPVVFIPSTWLSALDSAHGGKNALNFKSIKNLLGTYHFPKAVFVVNELLKQNPDILEKQAYGELLKMAVIRGGAFYKKLHHLVFAGVNSTGIIQRLLKAAVDSKRLIVKKDPFETKGERKKLNLGHTIGHVLEAVESLPHGLAVLHGLLFSLNWSCHKGFLSKKNYEEMKALILLNQPDLNFVGAVCFYQNAGFYKRADSSKNSSSWNNNFSGKEGKKAKSSNRIGLKNKKIPLNLFKHHLRQDKKHKQGFKIDFIFIKKPGLVFAQSVSEKDLIQEAKRQLLL